MPKLRSVSSLSDLCTQALVVYLTTYWTGSHADQIVSVLKRITVKYLRNALQVMIKTERIKPRHLNLLLDARFTEFDFEGKGAVIFDSNDFLFRLCTSCPNLTTVCLPFHSSICPNGWKRMLRQLPHLTKLDVTCSRFNDDVMLALVQNCPRMSSLAVADTDITDAGLCALYDMGQICGLESLDITCCKVTTRAVGQVLYHIRSLEEMETDYLCLVLERLHCDYKRGQDVDPEDTHKLKRASVTVLGEKANHIWVLCAYCPDLVDLQILGEVHDGCLSAPASLLHLTSLYIENDDRMVTPHGITSLLRDVGDKLRELVLVDYEADVLWDCLSHCRNLEKLSLKPLSMPLLTYTKDNQLVGNLNSLTSLDMSFEDITTYTIDERSLAQILVNCSSLESLRLERCPALTDDVVQDGIEGNSWRQLQQLSVQRCHELSQRGLWLWLSFCPIIARVFIGRCGRIGYFEISELEEDIETYGWDLKLMLHN